jgi:hypothetical protein
MIDLKSAIWFVLQNHKDLIALILLGVFSLMWQRSEVFRITLCSDRFLHSMSFLGIGTILAYLCMIGVYFAYPNYLQHTQSTITNVAWLAINGQPAYSDWKDGQFYGLMYGPLLYFVNGVFLLLGPSIAVSKVPGILALLCTCYVIWLTLKWKGIANRTAFFLLSTFIVLIAPYGIFGYWNRSEPFLILIASLSFIAALKPRPVIAAAMVGALAGIATGFKIHGIFYLIPAALAGLGRIERTRDRLIAGGVGISASIMVALLPFLWSNVFSLVTYWKYLSVAMDHGFLIFLFEQNFCFGLVLLLPALVIWRFSRAALHRAEAWFLIGLILPILATEFIGSTAGAGPHHLLPFLPLSLYGLAAVLVAPKARNIPGIDPTKMAMLMFAWLLLSHIPAFLLESEHSMKGHYSFSIERAKIAELENVLRKYPKAEMGPSSSAAYADTFYGVLDVFNGASLHMESAAWMDLSFDSSKEDGIFMLLSQCRVPVWIFPLGKPFSIDNFYTQSALFPVSFQETFKAKNRLIWKGDYYQVWACNS